MNWKKKKIIECCSKVGSGATPKGGATVYVETGTSLIRSQNVYNLSFDYDGLAHINNGAADKLKGVTVEENDILLNITGDSVARTCMVPKDVLPARVNQHVAIVRTKKDVMDSRFLNYYLVSPYMQAYMLNLAVGKGASRNAMTKGMIENFEVPCPDLPIQKRIADILSAYDDLIEVNRKQIKLLEEAAERLYREWFIDLRFPGHETATFNDDGLPEGWKKDRLDTIANIVMGQSPSSDNYNDAKIGLPFHQGVTTYGNRFVVDNVYSAKYSKVAEQLDVLFSVRAPVGRLNITKNKIAIGRGLSAIRHKANLQSFLFYALKNEFYKEDIIGNGSIFSSITKEQLYSYKLVIPTIELQKKYDEIAREIDKQILGLDSQMVQAAEARDLLLPRLMNGEIQL